MFKYRNDWHKNDCACAVCQVTRRKKEKDEILAVIENDTAAVNSNISDQQIMEVRIVIQIFVLLCISFMHLVYLKHLVYTDFFSPSWCYLSIGVISCLFEVFNVHWLYFSILMFNTMKVLSHLSACTYWSIAHYIQQMPATHYICFKFSRCYF